MEDKIRIGYLFDFYGELLNEHQRNVMEDYFFNDLSLSEIADEHGISRQGVHDLVKRCSKTLEDYEDKLHLLEKFLSIKDKVNEISNIAESDLDNKSLLISKLSNEILEEL